MYKNGLSVEKIAEFTGIEPKKVLKLIEKVDSVQEPAEKY
jgi:transposase-like protein